MRIERRFAPFIYGIIQAAMTTAVATAIATYGAMGLGGGFIASFLASWLFAWLTMVPIVIAISPLIQRAVLALTVPDRPAGR